MLKVFGASWCGPTKMLRGSFKRNGISYSYTDIEGEPLESQELDIRGVPTTILEVDGKEEKRWVGFSEDMIKDLKEVINDK